MKKTNSSHMLALVEGAMMLALAWALDFVCAMLPFNRFWVNGGGITLGMIPIVYYSFRRGSAWGIGAGVVFSGLQMLMGWYVPPANTWWAVLLCVLLDYVLAFSILGAADLMTKVMFPKHRLAAYGMSAAAVCLIRYVFSALSGGILWGSYAFEGWNPWAYSILYNGSYMLPNAVLTGILVILLCKTMDPKTLKRMKK